MTQLLEARDLSLPGRLFDVSISMSVGELVCLIGPNGSGKTSLLHALANIGGPSGTVRIDGKAAHEVGSAQRPHHLTYLPASRELRWPLFARDLIALGGAVSREVDEAMEWLDLSAVASRRVDRLSTGERNRVLIARALSPRPRLLLLDEPTANLDPLWQIRLMQWLRDTLPRTGQSALVAIHDLDAAGRYGHRVIVMDGGRIAADGKPAAILASSAIPDIFGIERVGGEWSPALSRSEDRRSSP